MKDFLLKIPVDLHRQIKIFSAISGVTMTKFILDPTKEKIEMMDEKGAKDVNK